MAKDVLMKLTAVTKSYAGEGIETVALREVSMSIHKGEFVAIMGPSGSGKSTLMHILGFLDSPTSGKYLFEGNAVENLSDDELANIRSLKISFVFQSFNLLPKTTVLENIQLPLLYQSGLSMTERIERSKAAAASVGLSERLHHLSNQLSGGQQQRVAIARALVTNPQVIFADEPTGNLDTASGKQVMDILKDLHTEGHTIILVTHDRTTAENARRIITIRDGKIESDVPHLS